MLGYLVVAQRRSVQENIIKARKAFFAFGSIQAFQGNLNPLSAISVFESCVLPILLYGCETWLLDSSTIQLLERFQLEIGRRILKLPKWFSGIVIRICLSLPSIVYRVSLRKIKYLAKLLVGGSKSISSRVFVSATIADPVNVSLIQQCKMLESIIGVSLVNQCLHSPDDVLHLISTSKADLLRQDECNLMLKGNADNHPANLIAQIADSVSWRKLWDSALDHGPRGTEQLQRIVFHLARPTHANFCCNLCNHPVDSSWLFHLCSDHTVTVNSKNLGVEDISRLLISDSDDLFKIKFP